MYLYVRIDAWDFDPKRKEHPSAGDDASTAEAAPGRVGRDEQGEARRANTTSSGGPHLELRCLRLKIWSESDLSIAETTWQTCLYIPLWSLRTYGTKMHTAFPLLLCCEIRARHPRMSDAALATITPPIRSGPTSPALCPCKLWSSGDIQGTSPGFLWGYGSWDITDVAPGCWEHHPQRLSSNVFSSRSLSRGIIYIC